MNPYPPQPSISFLLNRLSLGLMLILTVGNLSVALGQADKVHESENAISQFGIHPELDVELFASEPMMANPTNIDIDHLGRVWVCEVINYRQFRNGDSKPREKGDRILILEDTDGDAKADSQKVFYQGRDIDSVHGICVLGDRVLVSANDSVFYLIDSDGDSKADRKEVLFTGIGGTQHDHGIHAFVFGPDGKLYFNFGNSGRQIKDKAGKQIIDKAGNPVIANSRPYNQGMIFRCNLDGSDFETLAWNFRNNWEVCIDSFGSLWQSDNDDDGNRATRINFVMPFGNYGYTDQRTGAGWRTQRTGMHPDVPTRHWYQNDPGIVPNLLITGAGSPTGICVYEGDSLPPVFQNQMIHCDAGPNIVRAYPVKVSGAGYSASIVNMMDGAEKNRWFRPSDVCVAPDGSLIVADWYDPGVGGHRMQDVQRGRLFRVTAKNAGGKYQSPAVDFSTPELSAQALGSPNLATRYLAWKALQGFGSKSVPALEALWSKGNPRHRARALWALGNLNIPKTQKIKYIKNGLSDANPDLQITAIRMAVLLQDQVAYSDIYDDIDFENANPALLRAILVGMRQWMLDPTPKEADQLVETWATIASMYRSPDRWFLEALGIAAENHWDACLAKWRANFSGDPMASTEMKDILWRSRGKSTVAELGGIIKHPSTTADQTKRYFRALDFLNSYDKANVLAEIAFSDVDYEIDKSNVVLMESANRLTVDSLNTNQLKKLNQLIEQKRGTPDFISLVNRFSVEQFYSDVLKISADSSNPQLAADAMKLLLNKEQGTQVKELILHSSPETQQNLCDALANSGTNPGGAILNGLAKQSSLELPLRNYAIKKMGESQSGARTVLSWITKKEKIDPGTLPAIQATLHGARWNDIRQKANELFPIAATKNSKPLPSMDQLSKRKGDAAKGKLVFENAGTCAKCHLVNGKGIEVGPDLSEIGNKLSKIALYESILFPSAGISHNYENWMIQKSDGRSITGVLLGETDAEIQIKDDKGIQHNISVDEIDARKRQQVSLMPADLHKELTTGELVDLVEYLSTLKKKKN
ncbi:MAG: c-type cytochrome [Mariniblastus sp.]|nr:c-type cytochrome [Mariniblastus sp.]